MDTDESNKTSASFSRKQKVLFAACISAVLIALLLAVIVINRNHPLNAPGQITQNTGAIITNQTAATTSAPLYHKKQLVFKRMVGEPDLKAIRLSANSTGYKALSFVPPSMVAPPPQIRMPQFLSRADLNNYQALSTLGTQQYYSNTSVQQFLNNLSSQQYLNDLRFQQFTNNLNIQQRLNDLKFQQYTANLNFQQYLTNLNTQIYQNNLNNQTYLNNFNLNTQNYLNNLNSFTSPFYQPNFYTPPAQLYTPPIQFYTPPIQSYTPPVHFYTPPVQFYNPPPIRTFP